MKFWSSGDIRLNRKASFVGWFILLFGFITTALVTSYVIKKNEREDRLRFDYEKNTIIRRIEASMQNFEGALVQTRAFLLNSEAITRNELQGYLKDTELIKRFSGLQGLGYALVIQREELKSHEEKMRSMIPGYKVWPISSRDFLTSIIVIEPDTWRNKRAIGYDMFSEPVRREAMERARDLDQAILSDKVKLVQEKEHENLPGFLLYLPHYKKGSDISTVEKRRENILGFVYSPFRAKKLFRAILENIDTHLDVEIFNGKVLNKENLYFDFDGKPHFDQPTKDMEATETMILNGQTLTLHFTPLDSFARATSPFKTLGVLFGGLFITFIFLLIFVLVARQMITATVVAEEKEKLLQKEKEHVASRDEFLSIASHELKTPLTSLKLQSQLMMRAIKRNDSEALSREKVVHLIRQIDHQTSRLTRLVDDMLDISRIRTGRLRILKEEVDLSEIVMEVVDRLKPQFVESTGHVPEVIIEEKIRVPLDRFRIEQVLNNLLTNAIRYGNQRPVKVTLKRIDHLAKIEVMDQGIGIAPENIQKIFERFERAGMSASEVSGLGLGLFITNQIVKAHGGFIDVKSAPGKGSTFTVHLPV
ncbi:MAG: CHASE domain-containing protein [Bacteriovoracia bacterium]